VKRRTLVNVVVLLARGVGGGARRAVALHALSSLLDEIHGDKCIEGTKSSNVDICLRRNAKYHGQWLILNNNSNE
jgi:hypothetical protein